VANFCANTAMWLQLLSLGWLVKYLTENGTHSALLVVGVGGAASLPGIIIGPLGGVLGDRLDRRILIMCLEFFMVILALFFTFLVATGFVEVWHAYAYAFLSGCCEAIKMPVRQALISNTVPSKSLSNAYATSVVTIPGTRMIGPFVGGILLKNMGFEWNFLFEAFLYTGVIIALIPMKTPYFLKRKFAQSQGLAGFFDDLIDGFRYLWVKQRPLALLYLLSLVPNVICHPVLFLLPLFTSDVLGKGVDYGGYLLAINGAGGFVLVLCLSAFGFPKAKGLLCLLSALLSAVLTLLLSQSIWIFTTFLLLALFGASQTVFRTTNGLLTQTLTDDHYRVRVMSVYRLGMGMVVFFGLLVGWLSGIFSVAFTLIGMGFIGICIVLFFFLFANTIRTQL
jgi:MFS family permease